MAVEVRQGGLQWEAGIDTSKLEQDAQRIEQEFEKINQKQKIAENNLRNAIGKNLGSVVRAAREEFAGLSPEIQRTQTYLATLSSEIRNVDVAEKNLSRAFQQGKITQEQYASTSAALSLERKRIADTIREETKAISENERLSRMQNGSMDQKRAKLAQMIQQWNALSTAQRNNAQVGGALRNNIRALDKEITSLDRSMRSARGGGMILNQVLMATAGIFTLTQGTRLVRDIINVRGEIEQLEVAFSTMLQSKEKADQLMKEIVEVATTTPFKLTEVADATKQLLAYGFAQEQIKPELLAIGNIASGVGATFQEVAYAYGTLKTQGRAFARDIRQFTTRGIPIVAELAKQFNTTESEINNMVSAGKIGFPEVQKAFQSMTGAGGMFFNLMEKQSQTVTGEIAKLQDRIQLMFNEIGKGNDGLIKSGISGLSFMVENYKSIVDILGALVISYGAYRAALIATAATQATLGASTMAWGRILVGLRTTIQSLNTALVTSPLGAFTALLTALGVAAYSVSQTMNTAKAIQDNYNKSIQEGEKAAVKERAAIDDLIRVINSNNTTRDQQKAAIDSLRAMMGDHLKGYTDEEIAAGKATDAIDGYTEAIKNNISTKQAFEQYNQINEQLAELETKGIDAIGTFRRVGEQIRNTFDPTRNISLKDWTRQFFSGEASNEIIVKQAKKNLEEQRDALLEVFNFTDEITGNKPKTGGLTRLFDTLIKDVTTNFDELTKVIEGKADAEKIKEELQNKLDGLAPTDSQINAIKSQLIKINQVLETYSIKNENKELRDSAKEQEKILEDINKMESKALKRSHERNQQEVEGIKQKYEEIRKAIREAGFVNEGAILSRVDNIEQSDLQNLDYRTGTEELKKELGKRRVLYENYERHIADFGIKSANERYKEELGAFRSYFEQIQDEYNKLTTLKPEQRSGVQEERLEFLKDELDKEKIIVQNQYDDLLKRSQNYEQRRQVITETYQREREKILLAGDTEYLAQFDKIFRETVKSLNEEAFKDNSGYTQFFENIEYTSRKAALEGIEVLRKKLLELRNIGMEEGGLEKGGITEEQFIKINAQLDNTVRNLKGEIIPHMNSWASSLNEIASAIGDANSGFAVMLKTVGNLITQTAQIKTNIDAFRQAQASNNGAGDALGMVTAGLGVASGVIGGIMSVVNLIKSAGEKQIALQKEALALQKQIYYGELELSKVKRERALEDAKAGQTTLDGLRAQQKVIEESFKGVDEGINAITQKFNKSFENLSVGEMLSVQFEDALKEMMYFTGETKTVKSGFLGLGRKEVQVMESLAGLDFSQIEELSISGKLTEEAEAVFQKLKQLKEEGKELDETLKEIEKELNNIFTGGLEWSGMADGIIAEFQGAGSQIEEILQNAILNGFKYRFLEEPLQKLIDQFAEDAQSGDELTQSEIDKFTQAYSQLSEDAQKALKQLEESTGISLSGQQPVEQVQKGLSGAIRREMTEATASELSGLFRGFYDLTKVGNNTSFEHLKVGKQQADTLIAIQVNTFNTVGRLDMALIELRNISRNTKPGQSGRDLGIAP